MTLCFHPSMFVPFRAGARQVLGEQLLDFLHLFGEDFDVAREGISVRGGGFRFKCHGNPPHPQAGDPVVIEVGTMVYHPCPLRATRVPALDTLRINILGPIAPCRIGLGSYPEEDQSARCSLRFLTSVISACSPGAPVMGRLVCYQDPLNCMNNVGRCSFAIGGVQRAFFEALTTLKATMVRVNQDGKEVGHPRVPYPDIFDATPASTSLDSSPPLRLVLVHVIAPTVLGRIELGCSSLG